jgi:hypothetical protein
VIDIKGRFEDAIEIGHDPSHGPVFMLSASAYGHGRGKALRRAWLTLRGVSISVSKASRAALDAFRASGQGLGLHVGGKERFQPHDQANEGRILRVAVPVTADRGRDPEASSGGIGSYHTIRAGPSAGSFRAEELTLTHLAAYIRPRIHSLTPQNSPIVSQTSS